MNKPIKYSVINQLFDIETDLHMIILLPSVHEAAIRSAVNKLYTKYTTNADTNSVRYPRRAWL